ncbi:MAG: hypothetical protein ACP5NK_05115 [Thermoplasmata archaeon]
MSKQQEKLYKLLHDSRLSSRIRERNDEILDSIMDQIISGSGRYKILKETGLPDDLLDTYMEIAKARLHVKGKFSRWNRIWIDKYASMYSTPEIIGVYRARRLKDYSIVDIGAGAGLQAVMFSLFTDVTAIERVKERFEMSLLNAQIYKSDRFTGLNMNFPFDDGSIRIDQYSLIFSDPLRTESSVPRSLSSLSPSPLDLIGKYGDATRNFVFDLPPRMNSSEIGMDGEIEYISIDGVLARLTYYSRSLSVSSRRAVLLPEGRVITGSAGRVSFNTAEKPMSFIYVPDIAIVRADLIHEISAIEQMIMISEDQRRLVLTSDIDLGRDFPGAKYTTISVCGKDDLLARLKEADAGRVFMRFRINDSGEYYGMKNRLERELTGREDIYLFRHKMEFILAKKS